MKCRHQNAKVGKCAVPQLGRAAPQTNTKTGSPDRLLDKPIGLGLGEWQRKSLTGLEETCDMFNHGLW